MSTPPRDPNQGADGVHRQGYGDPIQNPSTQNPADYGQPGYQGQPQQYGQYGSQPGQPYGYGQQPYQGMTTDNGKSTGALVCGILGLVLTVLFWPIGIILDIVAIILGVLAGKEIKRSGGMQRGAGKAKAGLICGIVGIVLTVLLLAFFAANADEISRQIQMNQ